VCLIFLTSLFQLHELDLACKQYLNVTLFFICKVSVVPVLSFVPLSIFVPFVIPLRPVIFPVSQRPFRRLCTVPNLKPWLLPSLFAALINTAFQPHLTNCSKIAACCAQHPVHCCYSTQYFLLQSLESQTYFRSQRRIFSRNFVVPSYCTPLVRTARGIERLPAEASVH
jgi:hypothetical protein